MAIRELSEASASTPDAPARRCVILARPQTEIGLIRELLAEREIEAVASYERPWLGARPLDTVTALIDDSSLVVAIIDGPTTSPNIIFELGYAFARDKKILLLLDPSFETVPFDLAAIPYIRAAITDQEAIVFALEGLLAAPTPARRPHIPKVAQTHPIGSESEQLIERLAAALQHRNYRELESVIVDALHASGVSIVQMASHRDLPPSGPDLGIWSDDLESSVSNPLLIEVKARLGTTRDADQARRQVESYLRARSASWGLVLYGEGPSRVHTRLKSNPPVLFLRIGELIARLRTEGFAVIVSSLHSQAIRGL